MVLAPEHPLVDEITTGEYYEAINQYKEDSSKRSERDRIADAKSVSGQFTGAYALNPFTHEEMPVYIADYILMGYGTGAIMAVPAHDERDHRFAKHFNLPIREVIKGGENVQEEAFSSKDGICVNSKIIDGLKVQEAQNKIIAEIEKLNIGHGTINYRLRDAVFSRQRYWGEPIPIYYKKNIPYVLPETALPLILPEVEKYLPTEEGEPPLGRAKIWAWDTEKQQVVDNESINHITIFPLELNTMPGWAGSSWYFLRYADPHNANRFADEKKVKYWENVDLYIGGNEHATGHLLYSRFWNKFLKDYGYVDSEEPFRKLINQGMILGQSAFVYRINNTNNFISYNLIKDRNVEVTPIHIDVNLLKGTTDEVDIKKLRLWREEFKDAEFITEDGKLIAGREIEKMSKSKYNVLNPDDVCEEYGADTLRMYEMFLGPIEQSKPWNTQGLVGVHNFLKKFWKLYHSGENESFHVSEEKADKEELRVLHQLIKKVQDDVQNFSFNTSVSSFMIATNELAKLKSDKRGILEPLAVLISPFAPHIAEELWKKIGYVESIEYVSFPEFNAEYLVTDNFEYPVSFNGKVRFKIEMPASATPKEVEKVVMTHPKTSGYLDGKTAKKIIVVPKRIVNVVI
jgi:leucyl-tRNA synthetase